MQIPLNGGTNSDTEILTGITNANDCIPFITGIINNSTTDDADSGTAIAYLENATTLRIEKGSNANDVTVYVTLVEFTGAKLDCTSCRFRECFWRYRKSYFKK